MKTIAFYTLGCRLNQAEEEKLRRQFNEAGFFVARPELADIIVINTCSITGVADKKSRQAIRRLKGLNDRAKIVVIGCGANELGQLPEVDLAIGNKDKDKVFTIITQEYSLVPKFSQQKSSTSKRTRALLKIQDGCNNFCAYCIVPYLRGREKSLSLNELVSEAIKLRKLGYNELVLSGVNVGRHDDLEGLINELLVKTDFPRIRLSSINPQDITPKLIKLWSRDKRLCRHFHLSLQSGCDETLKRMGRPYNGADFTKVVNLIRKEINEVAITTDVIVGFPGETAEEFTKTCDFIKKTKFAKIHVFPYSVREGTKASKMTQQIDSRIKKERAKILRDVSSKLRENYLHDFVGKTENVLFEEKKGSYWWGLTSNYIKVRYEGKVLINQILPVTLKKENIF